MPDGRKLRKLLSSQGCTITPTGSGHLRVTCPEGVVIVASTPSDRRAWLNDRSRLRRAGVTV